MSNHELMIWQIGGNAQDFVTYAFEDYASTVKKQGGQDFPPGTLHPGVV